MAVLFPRHLTPQRRQETISHIQTFRDYFHYHIKASKVIIFHKPYVKAQDNMAFCRLTSTRGCDDGRRISCRVCTLLFSGLCNNADPLQYSTGRDLRTRRKSARQQAVAHSESRDDGSKSMSLIKRSPYHRQGDIHAFQLKKVKPFCYLSHHA